jgi:hypothetical protein
MCVINLFWAVGSLMNSDYELMPTFDFVQAGIVKMNLFDIYEKVIIK